MTHHPPSPPRKRGGQFIVNFWVPAFAEMTGRGRDDKVDGNDAPPTVTPAKAGGQFIVNFWAPAFAGVTRGWGVTRGRAGERTG